MTVIGPGAEQQRIDGFGRLDLGLRQASDWYLWGPYVSDRQWGTVREDYSADGDAWTYFPHDTARSRAYRWGEDGLAGWCDIEQRLCLSLALWNGRDAILKERRVNGLSIMVLLSSRRWVSIGPGHAFANSASRRRRVMRSIWPSAASISSAVGVAQRWRSASKICALVWPSTMMMNGKPWRAA